MAPRAWARPIALLRQNRFKTAAVRSAAPTDLSTASAGSVAKLEWIIAELLPADIATDVMTRRGAEMKQLWESLTTTPLYEELTVWVMAAWPDADGRAGGHDGAHGHRLGGPSTPGPVDDRAAHRRRP